MKLIITNLIQDDIINEDSEALSFNYYNQFADSTYGNDLEDNTTRIVYGIENYIHLYNQKLDFNINQSYDFKEQTNYTTK